MKKLHFDSIEGFAKTEDRKETEIDSSLNTNNLVDIELSDKVIETTTMYIECLDDVLKDIILDDKMNVFLELLYSENYNKLTPGKRINLFGNINLYIARSLENLMQVKESNIGIEWLLNPDLYVSDNQIDNDIIYFYDDTATIYKEAFNQKNCGITLFVNYINALKRNIIVLLIDNLYQYKVYELKGITSIYYDNMAESIFYGEWNNFKDEDSNDYTSQPIVADSSIFAMKIMMELLKRRYKKYHSIDLETSNLAYGHMTFISNLKLLENNRKRIIKENKKNINKLIGESKEYFNYLSITLRDLSKLSDDQFYYLLNSKYYNAYQDIRDPGFIERMTNVSNELLHRTFKDFDLNNDELPKYEFKLTENGENIIMIMTYNGEQKEIVYGSYKEVLENIINTIATVAKDYDLFKFKSEKEKEDYLTMKEWKKLKNNSRYSEEDLNVVNDTLNICSQKVTEIFIELNKKIDNAIAKYNKGGSSIIYTVDNEANYDYHEFKNGYSKEEIQEKLMRYIKEDLNNMKKRNSGGR